MLHFVAPFLPIQGIQSGHKGICYGLAKGSALKAEHVFY